MRCRTRWGNTLRVALAVAMGLWLSTGDGRAEAPAGEPVIHMTNVTGTVATVGDSGASQPQTIGIVSPERRIYLIGDEGLGKDLQKLVGKTVTVAAMVKRDVDGWPYLAVEWYRVLEG